MSLFTSLQLTSNALRTAQVGLQVTGNNIANANTPGYIRQRVILEPASTQRVGNLVLGLGVNAKAIVQEIDVYLEERLRSASSELANGEAQENAYIQLETLIGELSDTDLSTALTSFFGAINDIANQPESISARNLAVLAGRSLTDDIRRLDERVRSLVEDTNSEIVGIGQEINDLLEEIARLNVQIVTTEGGSTSASDAVGLRDQRYEALTKLAEITDIQVNEQVDGSVSVVANSHMLVFNGTANKVEVAQTPADGIGIAEIRVAATESTITSNSGRLGGLIAARDDIFGGFRERLGDFSRTLAYEFNRVYSGGQGLSGFTETTSEFAVDDINAVLDQTNLPFTPENGSFQIHLYNEQTGLKTTHDVQVLLNGDSSDTRFVDLVAQLDAIDGISAATTPDRRLSITSDSPILSFGFANDTSGTLASLGLNTFFSGQGATDIAISDEVASDPSKFAASLGGIEQDVDNIETLAGFLDHPLPAENNETIAIFYDRLISDTTQAASVSRSVADGFRVFQRTLEGQKLGISGVSIDEEAVRMVSYQRAYQASARMIQTISDLLDVLVNL